MEVTGSDLLVQMNENAAKSALLGMLIGQLFQLDEEYYEEEDETIQTLMQRCAFLLDSFRSLNFQCFPWFSLTRGSYWI